MIEEIQKTIMRHGEDLRLGAFAERDVRVSKFFHGRGKPDGKVLFFVTVNGVPACILKSMRSPEYNGSLEKEHANELVAPTLMSFFKAPKVYFKDFVGDLFMFAEEIVPGKQLGKAAEEAFLPRIYEYQSKTIERGAKISIQRLVDLLDEGGLGGYAEYDQVRALLGERAAGGVEFMRGFNHGDLTSSNIYISGEGPHLLDWEHAGDRIAWGADFCHYFVRCHNINNERTVVAKSLAAFREKLADFAKRHGIDADLAEFETSYLIDRLYDILEKDLGDHYAAMVEGIKTL